MRHVELVNRTEAGKKQVRGGTGRRKRTPKMSGAPAPIGLVHLVSLLPPPSHSLLLPPSHSLLLPPSHSLLLPPSHSLLSPIRSQRASLRAS